MDQALHNSDLFIQKHCKCIQLLTLGRSLPAQNPARHLSLIKSVAHLIQLRGLMMYKEHLGVSCISGVLPELVHKEPRLHQTCAPGLLESLLPPQAGWQVLASALLSNPPALQNSTTASNKSAGKSLRPTLAPAPCLGIALVSNGWRGVKASQGLSHPCNTGACWHAAPHVKGFATLSNPALLWAPSPRIHRHGAILNHVHLNILPYPKA